jgi:dethiobiotin synthetase
VAALFVTATGTDLGKTFVTAGLAARLRQQGRSVAVLKPIVTGFATATAATSDPAILLQAVGRPATDEEIARIAPWRFRSPLAPDMAARQEGRVLEFDAVVGFCRAAADSRPDALLIEGVGGIMVPLTEQHTVLDWMVALRPPVLLVAGSYLGTISHTLSAVDVLRRHDVPIAAIVISESAGSPVPLMETAASIARFVDPTVVFALPRLETWADEHPVFDAMATLL